MLKCHIMKRLLLILSFLLPFLSCSAAFALDNAVNKKETITIGAYNRPPWYMISKTGKPIGIFPTLAERLSSASLEIRIVPMPYERMINTLEGAHIDLLASVENPILVEKATPFVKIGTVSGMLFTNKPLYALLDEQSKTRPRIAVLKGMEELVAYFTPPDLYKRWDVVEMNTEAALFHATGTGRVDGSILSSRGYNYFIASSPANYADNTYIDSIGTYNVYTWLPKNRKATPALLKLKEEISRISLSRKTILLGSGKELPVNDKLKALFSTSKFIPDSE